MYVGLLHINQTQVVKRIPAGVVRKFGEGVPAQVSSLTSDRGSNLRCPSQNKPCVAAKMSQEKEKKKEEGHLALSRLEDDPPISAQHLLDEAADWIKIMKFEAPELAQFQSQKSGTFFV
ncbi:hypothetical protein AVEN_244369-1 [Araneus ventricosus]|uniref:Uncharacterized protein n=1 Tax=Araneus ventricosus TaxID=182803 RepID=A0A4Y2NI46_ARAVE|nr:hypothetical protein AVEN_244369-1 [Araneus ventricosus]